MSCVAAILVCACVRAIFHRIRKLVCVCVCLCVRVHLKCTMIYLNMYTCSLHRRSPFVYLNISTWCTQTNKPKKISWKKHAPCIEVLLSQRWAVVLMCVWVCMFECVCVFSRCVEIYMHTNALMSCAGVLWMCMCVCVCLCVCVCVYVCISSVFVDISMYTHVC